MKPEMERRLARTTDCRQRDEEEAGRHSGPVHRSPALPPLVPRGSRVGAAERWNREPARPRNGHVAHRLEARTGQWTTSIDQAASQVILQRAPRKKSYRRILALCSVVTAGTEARLSRIGIRVVSRGWKAEKPAGSDENSVAPCSHWPELGRARGPGCPPRHDGVLSRRRHADTFGRVSGGCENNGPRGEELARSALFNGALCRLGRQGV